MKYSKLIILFAAASLTFQVQAETKKVIIVEPAKASQAELEKEINQEGQGSAAAQGSQSQKVVILNNQPQETNVVQQPVTNVEASPLVDSRAVQIRKSRQDAEIATEQRIVEKLEQSRLEDEKARAERLFGNKLDAQTQQQQQQQAASVQVVQSGNTGSVVEVKQAPVQENKAEIKKIEVIDEDASAVSSVKADLKDVEENKESTQVTYVGGMLGMVDYAGVRNIKSKAAFGFSVGSKIDDQFGVEGSFTYSNHLIDARYWADWLPVFKDMKQYNIEVAGKYYFLKGRFSPVAGGVASYTYRTFSDKPMWGYLGYGKYGDASSSAFDLGLLIGAEFEVSKKFAIGVGYKYYFNLTSFTDNYSMINAYRADKAIEEANYQVFGISVRGSF